MVKVISFLGSSTVKWLKWENLKHQHGLLEIVGYPPLSSSSLPAVNAGVCVFNTLILSTGRYHPLPLLPSVRLGVGDLHCIQSKESRPGFRGHSGSLTPSL